MLISLISVLLRLSRILASSESCFETRLYMSSNETIQKYFTLLLISAKCCILDCIVFIVYKKAV
jgi:hypothetical protein